jgi:hypothetical protein
MDKRPHIVVVEDEAGQRQLLLDYLGTHGFRVSGAKDGVDLRRLANGDQITTSRSKSFASKRCLRIGAIRTELRGRPSS